MLVGEVIKKGQVALLGTPFAVNTCSSCKVCYEGLFEVRAEPKRDVQTDCVLEMFFSLLIFDILLFWGAAAFPLCNFYPTKFNDTFNHHHHHTLFAITRQCLPHKKPEPTNLTVMLTWRFLIVLQSLAINNSRRQGRIVTGKETNWSRCRSLSCSFVKRVDTHPNVTHNREHDHKWRFFLDAISANFHARREEEQERDEQGDDEKEGEESGRVSLPKAVTDKLNGMAVNMRNAYHQQIIGLVQAHQYVLDDFFLFIF